MYRFPRPYSTLLKRSGSKVRVDSTQRDAFPAGANPPGRGRQNQGTGSDQKSMTKPQLQSTPHVPASLKDEEHADARSTRLPSGGRIRSRRPRRPTIEAREELEKLAKFDKVSKEQKSQEQNVEKPKKEPVPVEQPEKIPPNTTPQQNGPKDFNWYWESLPPTYARKRLSNQYFTDFGKSAKLLRSFAQFRTIPESDVPEVAFVGRSNVGKSSLLNAVVGADFKSLLARTSATPGFTKTMNFYGVGGSNGVRIKKQADGRDKIVGRMGLTIVDMPGYGEGSLSQWGVEIMKYFQSRKQLRRVFVLLDVQHGIKDKDRSLLASLRLAGVSHQVILSKLDKMYIPKAKEIKQHDGKAIAKVKSKGTLEELRKVMEKLKGEIKPQYGGGALGEILCCSAETLVDGKRLGIDHVRYAILKAAGLDEDLKKKK